MKIRAAALEMAIKNPPGTKVKAHWWEDGRVHNRLHGEIVGYEQINFLGYVTLTPIIRVRDGLMAGYECWWSSAAHRLAQVRNVIRKVFSGSQTVLEMSDGGKVCGYVVSKTFEGMPHMARQNMLWTHLKLKFDDAAEIIGSILTMTPAEVEK